MKKKRVFISAIVALLAVVAIGATLAYLTDEKTVVNTFSVGDVDILLDEALVNTDGEPIDGEGVVVEDPADAKRVAANSYKMIPNHEYTKDPTVTVKAGSEESYIRILVTANKVSEWTAILGDGYDLGTIFTGYNADWERKVEPRTDADGNAVYEYWYKETVTPSATEDTVLPALFKGFKVPGTITNEQLTGLNGFTLTIVANAIQADGFEDATAAWAAFDAPIAPAD